MSTRFFVFAKKGELCVFPASNLPKRNRNQPSVLQGTVLKLPRNSRRRDFGGPMASLGRAFLAILVTMLAGCQSCSFLVTSLEVPSDEEAFNKMNFYLRFRGPDLTTTWQRNGLAFVHNLLHMTGSLRPQPFRSPDNGTAVVYNGEVYNADTFGGTYQSDG